MDKLSLCFLVIISIPGAFLLEGKCCFEWSLSSCLWARLCKAIGKMASVRKGWWFGEEGNLFSESILSIHSDRIHLHGLTGCSERDPRP